MAKPWSSEAKKLLDYINDDDMFQLASTICKSRLEFASKNDAIEATIAACESPEELLRKKKVKCEYLLRYIWEYGRAIDASATLPVKADKRQLIRHVLTFWGCGDTENAASASTSIASDDDDAYSNVQSSSPNELDSFLTQFSTRFLEWFYNLLNNCANEDFGAQHFYENCVLRLRCGSTNDQSVTVEVETGQVVAQRLRDFVLTERLVFQPNSRLPHGFQTLQESHGAILLKSNGTVHRRPSSDDQQLTLLGPYEQIFMLIEDPQSKSWKIQQTSLLVKAEIAISHASVEFR